MCEKMVEMVSRLEGKDLVLEPLCSVCTVLCVREDGTDGKQARR